MSAVRLFPQRLQLTADRAGRLDHGEFLIVSDKSLADLKVAPVGAGNPLSVALTVESNREDVGERVRVTVTGRVLEPVNAGGYQIEVRTPGHSVERTVLPVRITKKL